MLFSFNHTRNSSAGISNIFTIIKGFAVFLLASCFGTHWIYDYKNMCSWISSER